MPAKNTIKVLIGGKIITLSGYESEDICRVWLLI